LADAVVGSPCTQAEFDAALDSVQGSGGGTITFACGGPATITFTNQKRINVAVAIAGGNNVTLSGGDTTRLFNITSGASLTLQQITLTNGNAGSGNGGALFNRGTLVIQDSVVRNSQAQRGGGIYLQTGSNLTVTRSVFTGNSAAVTGGAIEVKRADAIISTSMISQNNAVFGGGVFNALGTTVMTRTTVNNNTATAGAGVNNNQGAMWLANVTISNNSATAGGAGMGNSGEMTLSFVTFSGNSASFAGGIYHYGFNAGQTLTISNTILDAGLGGQNCYVPPGSATAITTAGFNISSDASCTSSLTRPSDQNNVDPLLGPLANNGGATLTHFPEAGSPARNRGRCFGVAIDQRGVARPLGPACDIGSVESLQP
jgi:predicted outer membrane repeat protein